MGIRNRVFGVLLLLAQAAPASQLATAPVQTAGAEGRYSADGVVEAVRRSVISAQVAGRITVLNVRAGDRVRAGQVLARVDARAAGQQVAASQAMVASAQAQMAVAQKEYDRQHHLFEKGFISQTALDRAEAQFAAASAEARATLAQAGVAETQTDFHTLVAPYAGVVSAVDAELGDMAMPGKPLIEIYDPARMRVVATLPEQLVPQLRAGAPVTVELPAASGTAGRYTAKEVTVLPTTDPASHTVQVRLGLPAELPGLSTGPQPGLFARAEFRLQASGNGRLAVPASALIKRTELYAVYVVDAQGKPQLRQVRPGRTVGDQVEILAGLSANEHVALEPLAAARVK